MKEINDNDNKIEITLKYNGKLKKNIILYMRIKLK